MRLQFWATCIADLIIQGLGLLFLRESKPARHQQTYAMLIIYIAYAPVLLERKAKALRKSMDLEKGRRRVRTVYEKAEAREYVYSSIPPPTSYYHRQQLEINLRASTIASICFIRIRTSRASRRHLHRILFWHPLSFVFHAVAYLKLYPLTRVLLQSSSRQYHASSPTCTTLVLVSPVCTTSPSGWDSAPQLK